ncbi:response regulator [Algoriphagus aquimarinus]|uniref:histidine kinase n=1 Tax=Algoriphagus aquimarinus TaxID=237018 RepID=A0A5C7B1T9_9BACT|nr:response regulator [Algoriphagus aquimarinus]TXE14731.1 response regulator [Algoriphagus aquimarinus]
MAKDEENYHILVVEDNLGDFVILEEYLSESLLNLKTKHAESFKAAAEYLEDVENYFDIVFLDLSLPDKSGEELVLEIIKLAIGIPVVVLTGFSNLEFGSRSLALGASDYLLKDDLSPAILFKSLLYNIQRVKFISELKESRSKYSDLFQLNPSPIIVFDLETLKVLDINQAAILKYGYGAEEFLSMNLFDFRPMEDSDTLRQAIDGFWVKNTKDFKPITRHLKKNQEIIDVEISPAKIKINNKDAGLVLINDITENLKYIRKIEEQNEAFKEIAWIQSHVVRAPLARLLGLVNLLEISEEGASKENNELLEFIKGSVLELDKIVRDINEKSEIISSRE